MNALVPSLAWSGLTQTILRRDLAFTYSNLPNLELLNYFYDADGRQNQVENALGQYTTTTFTSDGQTASVKDNLGNTTAYAYGHGQELLSTTDPLNHTTGDEYDSRYRLIQTTDANGGVTQITLDPAGNEVKLVDPDGNATTWTYSPVNLPLTETNALGTTTTTYNLDGLTTSIEDADGRVRDFVYNNEQQLTAENWMSGSTIIATMAYSYDLAGELTSASDPNSAYAFAYNGDGDVTSTDNAGTPNVPDVVLTNTYDSMGDRLTQSATIAGTADYLNSYSYDADQNLTMVQQQGQTGGNAVAPKELDYDYNDLGLATDVWAYNTLSGPREDVYHAAITDDGDDDLTGLSYTSNGGSDSIDAFGYAFNADRFVTSFTSDNGTADYGYDLTGQLTSAVYTTATGGTQPANESYSYTANGNRNMSGYTTSSDNTMTSDGTYDYQHDADGNVVSRTQIANSYSTQYKTTYTWDYRNRLTDVDYYDNNGVLTGHVHYVYDVFDNLIGEEDDDTGDGSYDREQFYVVDAVPEVPQAGQPFGQAALALLQFDGNGNVTVRNLVALNAAGVDAVVEQELVSSPGEAGPEQWLVGDAQGSVREVLNTDGAVIDAINYNAVGMIASESDPSVLHWAGYANGHLSLATGMINFDERWYNPATGTWESPDPDGFAAGDTNLYRYVRNSPANGIDPTGLIEEGSTVVDSSATTNASGGTVLSWVTHFFQDSMFAWTASYTLPVAVAFQAPGVVRLPPTGPTARITGVRVTRDLPRARIVGVRPIDDRTDETTLYYEEMQRAAERWPFPGFREQPADSYWHWYYQYYSHGDGRYYGGGLEWGPYFDRGPFGGDPGDPNEGRRDQ